MLDLSIRNRQGKTVLHYLVEHKDEENFRILLDSEELTAEVANIPDKEGKTPMTYCLTKGKCIQLLFIYCDSFRVFISLYIVAYIELTR